MIPLFMAALASAGPAVESPPDLEHPHQPEAHEAADQRDDHGKHHSYHTIVAFKALGGWVTHDHHGEPSYGASLFIERVLVKHLLELELAAGWVRHGGADAVPLEALLKAPLLHFGRSELHAGAGAVVTVPLGHDSDAMVGGIATIDVFTWLRPQVGVLMEVNVQEYPARKDNLFEVECAVGLAVRF